jgi:hypothetical protein
MQRSKHKTPLLLQRAIVGLIPSTIWMGGKCTIFEGLAYNLELATASLSGYDLSLLLHLLL